MNFAGWGAAAVGLLAVLVATVSALLDHVVTLKPKAIAAIVAIREVREAWRGQRHDLP
ncbi:hypothetical protein ABT095_20855 [Kitasatospora sp. NPDC002227]|uniref:hypothetical protein n=1 Tax=Kitasatospora sp. NPDC002227 TaxID=3154773 RepID=UPI0033331C50